MTATPMLIGVTRLREVDIVCGRMLLPVTEDEYGTANNPFHEERQTVMTLSIRLSSQRRIICLRATPQR